MPASPTEVRALTETFDRAHSRPARALADLLIVGNETLESHFELETRIGDAFEDFVLDCARKNGVSIQEFKATVEALGRLRETIAELDQLPD